MTRVGILYPGYAAEDDFPRLAAAVGAELPVVHTSLEEDAHRVDALRDLGRDDRLAAGAARLGPTDAVLWACTSGSFVYGWDGAHRQAQALHRAAGVPASSTSIAFVAAARALDIHRVTVAATYPEDVARHFVDFLASGGIDVLRLASKGIPTAAEAGLLDRAAVLSLATANDDPQADAVFLPDTALHSVAWLDELEDAVGKPVLTANQVTGWYGLALAGDTAPRRHLGALFRLAAASEKE